MPSSGDLPRPGTEPAAPGAPASQADSLRLSHQGRPAAPWHNPNQASGPPAWAHSTASRLASPRGPGPGRERALTRSAGRGPRCAAAVRRAAPPPGSARCRAWCRSAQSWCPRLRWPPCRRERRLHLGLEGRGQLGARRGVPLGLRNTLSPGSPPRPGARPRAPAYPQGTRGRSPAGGC